ncbi:MAG: hypothetical protein KDA85_03025, partial [Planctomycetaceae bacterium]|nr:hypothetical protein [Planctomycetaceae bacterium]
DADSASTVDEAFPGIADMIGSGRYARIGRNVEQVISTQNGQFLFVDHGGAGGEKIRVQDLHAVESLAEIENISDPWGPNGNWQSLLTAGKWQVRDMRTGQVLRPAGEFPPTPDFAFFVEPTLRTQWAPLSRYNHASALSSRWLDYCVLEAINDDDEWAAVDTITELLHFRTGTREPANERYEFRSNDNRELPCIVARDDDGWFLKTPATLLRLETTNEPPFSPCGRFLLDRSELEIVLLECRSGMPTYQKTEQPPATTQGCFSSDGSQLLLLQGLEYEVVDCATGTVLAAGSLSSDDPVDTIEAVDGTAYAWRLKRGDQAGIAVLASGSLVYPIDAVDPGGRLVAAQVNDTWAINDLQSMKQITIDCRTVEFSADPQSEFFWTTHTSTDGTDVLVLRTIADPEQELRRFEAGWFSAGESRIDSISAGNLVLITEYEKEDSIDPPFQSRYVHETHILDSRAAVEIDSVNFVVQSIDIGHSQSQDLAILRGVNQTYPGDARDDRYAVIRSDQKKLVWKSDDDGRILKLLTDRAVPFFVVQYADAPATLHGETDGSVIGRLSGPATKIQFFGVAGTDRSDASHNQKTVPRQSPTDSNNPNESFMAVWYQDGRCELWDCRGDKPAILCHLGLIVSDLCFIPGRHEAVICHDDGRAYLINLDWLRHIQSSGLSTKELLREIGGGAHGPGGTPWWAAGHPKHYPWVESSPATEVTSDSSRSNASDFDAELPLDSQ